MIYRHRRRVGAGLGQVDVRRNSTVIPAADVVFVGDEGIVAAARVALRWTAGGDRYDLVAGCSRSVSVDACVDAAELPSASVASTT